MVLQATDELRHQSNTDFHWRESVYFNFNDASNGFGGWLYLWIVPNQPLRSGMLVSFYRGAWPSLSVTDDAMASPGHLLRAGESWLYCFQRNVESLLAADFDDIELCGLRLQRQVPLQRYRLAFDDQQGSSLELDCRFITPPYDYGEGVFPTPPWMAANRYHRAWWASGHLTIARRTYRIDCTGDSDHSWGQRDMGRFGDNLFKMWSFQSRDGRFAASVLEQGVDDAKVPLGFLSIDGRMSSVAAVETAATFDANGVQQDVDLTVQDADGRQLRARQRRMHSYLAWGSREHFWGFEGVGDYEVDGHGVLPGLSSYFWPRRVTPKELHAGLLK